MTVTYSVLTTSCLSVVIHGFDICDGVEHSSLQLKLECCHFETSRSPSLLVGGELKENYAHGFFVGTGSSPPLPQALAKSA
jgi:hypothetical protein